MAGRKKTAELVFEAIRSLRIERGFTPNEIFRYISANYDIKPLQLNRSVATALRRGVDYGIFEPQRGGRFRLAAAKRGDETDGEDDVEERGCAKRRRRPCTKMWKPRRAGCKSAKRRRSRSRRRRSMCKARKHRRSRSRSRRRSRSKGRGRRGRSRSRSGSRGRRGRRHGRSRSRSRGCKRRRAVRAKGRGAKRRRVAKKKCGSRSKRRPHRGLAKRSKGRRRRRRSRSRSRSRRSKRHC